VLVAVLAFPVVAGQPILPVEPVQILWINLVATVTLALPLAFEAHEPGLMSRPPRDPGEPLLSRFVVTRTIAVGALMAAVAIALFLLTRRPASPPGPRSWPGPRRSRSPRWRSSRSSTCWSAGR
jgi:magnesium-transporting ATPase (P-type)